MDPVTAVGLVASVLQVTTTCVKTVHTLEQLRHRFNAAPSSIEALYSESTIVSASLSHLGDLFNRSDNSLVNVLRAKPELSSALDKALSGCNAIYESLNQDLQKIGALPGDGNGKIGIRRRTSFLWRQDIFKTYLAQIHGHQNALTLLIQGLQMHSLSDISSLLRETKSILAEMSLAQDQVTLRGTPSIALSEASDTELDVDEKVVNSKSRREIMDTPATETQDPILKEPVQENVLINFSESASILDSAIDEQVSPALEDLKELGAIPRHEDHMPEVSTKRETSPGMEKRDSAQSHETPAASIAFKEQLYGSERRESVLLTPISPGTSSGSFMQRNASVSTAYSTISQASIQSEFPEVVEVDLRSDPFPALENRPSHVPPTTEEQLVSLQDRRERILKSDNVAEQLAWAEEALHFTSLATMYRNCISKLESQPREAPVIEGMLETDAKHLIENAAQKSDATALFLKGMYFGLNTDESTQLYMVALSKGHSRSAFYIGKVHERNKAIKKAISYYNLGADGRDSASHCRLAEAFLRGELNQKKDHKRAINHLQIAAAAADADYPQALFLLALLQTETYRQKNKIKESILPISEAAARQNFEKAAFLGNSNAQLRLGQAYSSANLGCTKDTKLALHYFRLAARRGEPSAELEISTLFWHGDGDVLQPNNKVAFVHARRAGEMRFMPSFCQIAYFYEHAIGVEKNVRKAMEWYMKGAAFGDEKSHKWLEAMKIRGGVAPPT